MSSFLFLPSDACPSESIQVNEGGMEQAVLALDGEELLHHQKEFGDP